MNTSASTPAGESAYAPHRAFVGPPERYDLASAGQFGLLTALGLREDHTLLDVGCGSLRGGRLFIPYLNAGKYFGIEPQQWLIDQGIDAEIGRDLVDLKKPTFSNDSNFTLTTFGRKFDFMLAQSIFSHAAVSQISRCLGEAAKALEPTGIMAATFFIGKDNYQGTEWVYPGSVHYTLEYFTRLASDAGLACKALSWTHTNQQTWVAICHPDHAAAVQDPADAARVGVLEHQLAAARQKLDQVQKLKGFRFLKKINRALGSKVESAVATLGARLYSVGPRMDASPINAPAAERISPMAKTGGLSGNSLPDRILSLADRHRGKLLIVLAAVYLLGFNGQWRIEPDSALYLTVGRNLAEGHGYTYHGQPQRLIFPGLPLMFAGIFKLFHTEGLLPALILMPLIGAAALGLVYRLFFLNAGRPIAVLMTFGVGISRLFYRYCFELLSDMPFLLGVMAFLVGYEAIFHPRVRADGAAPRRARWLDWVLLLAGLAVAIAMRPAMWALLLAIILTIIWSIVRGPVRWSQILILAAVIVGGVLFWKLDLRHGAGASMGKYEDALFEITFAHPGVMFHKLIFVNIPRLFEATLSQTLFGARLGVGLNSLAAAAIILVSCTMLLKRPLWAMWVGVTYAMMLFAIEPLDRYFLEVLPLLVYAWWRGLVWLNARMSRPWADRVFLSLFLLGGTINVLRIGEFVVEQHRMPFLHAYKSGRYASSAAIARELHDRVPPDGWVLTTPQFARIFTYLSRRRVIGPYATMRLDPANQMFYALQPLDDEGRLRIREVNATLGPTLGRPIESKYDPQPWRLVRVEPIK